MKLEFETHRRVLTSAVLNTIRNYVESHGGTFRSDSLSQMSRPLEETVGEALMFGADYWPAETPEDTSEQAKVVSLFEPKKAPSPARIRIKRSIFWLRIQVAKLLFHATRLWVLFLLCRSPEYVSKYLSIALAT